mmetsp:Transcript_13962/g.50163  ORF Transcript_13962/g.50163 Transcript_13962/m.50163 type:complete len:255 (-) Transcript_13962:45-809(-)
MGTSVVNRLRTRLGAQRRVKPRQQPATRPQHLAVHDRFRDGLRHTRADRVHVRVHARADEAQVALGAAVGRLAVVELRLAAAAARGFQRRLRVARKPPEKIRVEVRRLHVHHRGDHRLCLALVALERVVRGGDDRAAKRREPSKRLAGDLGAVSVRAVAAAAAAAAVYPVRRRLLLLRQPELREEGRRPGDALNAPLHGALDHGLQYAVDRPYARGRRLVEPVQAELDEAADTHLRRDEVGLVPAAGGGFVVMV